MTDPYTELTKRIGAGELILVDGATGTEIERRGVPQLENAWNGGGALSHPGIVRQVHQDYIDAGAQVIISNTFATSRHALRDAGVENDFEALNRRGVELAVEARDQSDQPGIVVAGGISYWSWTGDKPALDNLKASVSRQAEIMQSAGADLLMLEMMVDIDRMRVTLEAALDTGLPVWVGITCRIDDEGTVCLGNGEPLRLALEALRPYPVPLLSIMHTEVELIDDCLEALGSQWSGWTGVYAHSQGDRSQARTRHAWAFDGVISPEAYCDASDQWRARGINILGCCCGLGVAHIATLARHLTV
ncbi:MAG TPA: homocysteine methyltransferase [Gammaproteobacteria bacterium]|nr:homocysteine methyltransferase [Acidiferrobacteraceae bacterium]MDP6399597.1 homocysteine S-methyltransferase family protein [Arenicellales bacterium]HCX88862.1 homocysteine methyltransferase [Gammaproteobacteria bacterium]MDP6552875.1 homocysteine S-methyltransferase family protein [Arenicellales bacterium]MDP6791051.1 homocysteine S-methyltransferase family protein [Arenicellales bacterium]